MRFLTVIIITLVSQDLYGQFRSDWAPLRKIAFDNKINGIEHSWPLIVANETIIRGKELKEKYIDTIIVLDNTVGYAKFKNLAGLGVISVKTNHVFKSISGKEILESQKSKTLNRNTILAINGFLTDDLDIKISKNAIVRIDILLNANTPNGRINPDVAVINVWTITKKERRNPGPIAVGW